MIGKDPLFWSDDHDPISGDSWVEWLIFVIAMVLIVWAAWSLGSPTS